MKKVTLGTILAIAALAGDPMRLPRKSPAKPHDPGKLAAAAAKRERKNAKRAASVRAR